MIRPSWLLRIVAFPLLIGMSGCAAIYDRLGGPYIGKPVDAFSNEGLSATAKTLVDQAFAGFEHQTLRDYHVHFFGNGKPNRYRYCPELNDLPPHLKPNINFERIASHQVWWQRPFIRGIYLDTLDVSDTDQMDDQYMARLVDLVAHYGPPAYASAPASSPYRTDFHLMAMDGVYDSNGQLDDDSFNYVSNRYIVELVQCLNRKLGETQFFSQNRFVPIGSINPMQKNATSEGYTARDEAILLKEITDLAAHGVSWIKWRPPSMAIDPEQVPRGFYRELAKREIGILVHTGSSNGIRLDETLNQFASPEKMRVAIEEGVDVVMLHLGRTGKNAETQENFVEEFFSLLEVYEDTNKSLRGEISAVPYADTHRLLKRVAQQPASNRENAFINGSDYPAVTPFIFVEKSLRQLKADGWLSAEQVDQLETIFQYNPLLLDFVLKRTLVRNGIALPDQLFLGDRSRVPKSDRISDFRFYGNSTTRQ